MLGEEDRRTAEILERATAAMQAGAKRAMAENVATENGEGRDAKAPAEGTPSASLAGEPGKAHGGKPRRTLRTILRILAAAAAIAILPAMAFVMWPLPEGMLDRTSISSIRFTDRNGRLLREMRSFEDGRSVSLPKDQPVPPLLESAFLAAEDKRFGSHPGVDPLAVARSAALNLRHGRIVTGASTLHMQLYRMIRPHPKTFAGKAREALWALRLGWHLPDEQVLRAYLDRIPLGRDLVGVEAASHFYFNRPSSALSLAQAAVLAGVARSPAAADPFRHPQVARRHMERVLETMERQGRIDRRTHELAKAAPWDLVKGDVAFRAPHFVNALARSLEGMGLGGATTVETTLDLELQTALEKAMEEEIRSLAGRDVGNAAVIVLDNATGETLAYAGSIDFLDEEARGQIDGVRSRRQPGSALKPFAYGLGLSEGMTAATILSDVETHLATPTGAYVPRNYDRHVHGPVRLRAALANSYNVPAVQVMERLGPERVLQVLHEAGFDSLDETAEHYGVGLILGNGEVTLREMARAYMGLARGGVVGPVSEVRRAWNAQGEEMAVKAEMEPRRFMEAPAVALLTDIISDEAARSAAFGHTNALRLPFPVAAKTGTSRAHVDNWVAGFTRERTVAVWVGNFSGKPMKDVSGITGAGPVFRRAMLLAMESVHPRPLVKPEEFGFETRVVCPLSGELAGPHCGGGIREVFLPGTSPKSTCSVHLPDGRLALPPEFQEWAEMEGLRRAPEAMALANGNGEPRPGTASRGAMPSRVRPKTGFLLPLQDDEFLLDPALPQASQGIRVRVAPPPGRNSSDLAVIADDGPRIPLSLDFGAAVSLARGRHRLRLVDVSDGREVDSVQVRVR